MINKFLKNSERGQAIILIAFAIIGLVAIVGLMTDGGMLLVEYARLKRGIDAAAIGAALQYRKDYDVNDLQLASEEFLMLNQSDVINVQIDTCETTEDAGEADPVLCASPRRKLVRVTATRLVDFGFMRVIGFDSTTITATSTGEAASIDLVLVIDTSASMAYETTGGPNTSDPGDDPVLCNTDQNCEPLESVKSVALDFIDTMFFPYDRVAIVTMTSQTDGGFRNPTVKIPLTDDLGDVQDAIEQIKVFQPGTCPTVYGPCLKRCDSTNIVTAGHPCENRDVGDYWGQDCSIIYATNNPSSCNSSNVGGSLLMAGSEFARPGLMKEDSFWVVIALVGGPANATNGTGNLTDNDANGYPDDPLAFGWCPSTTWPSNPYGNPFCRDALASTRHFKNANGTFPDDYDADDYARDQADFLANPVTGQGVTVFTIGLGSLVQNAPQGDADAGEQLLRYTAESAGDIRDGLGNITGVANHGFYRYSPNASGLSAIFAAIAENILTRISK